MSAELPVAAIWEVVARKRKEAGDVEGAARAKVNKSARMAATHCRAKFAQCGTERARYANPGHYTVRPRGAAEVAA